MSEQDEVCECGHIHAPKPDEAPVACARCQERKSTVWVDTGFAGESEPLCGKCVSVEYAKLEKAAQKNFCSQCGQRLTQRACGPTHALLWWKQLQRKRKQRKKRSRK
jgi:hypothetical protein